jgi:N-acetylglucosaminyl-diphospho-decaprenol L-rhamnosyltransferase
MYSVPVMPGNLLLHGSLCSDGAVVVVVIVTFSAEAPALAGCVASVRTGGGCDRILVVDNGGWAEATGEDVELLRPTRNLGFGGGANLGFRRAAELGADAVALLNDDVEVRTGWLEPLTVALDSDSTLGAVQPKLLIAGTEPPRVNSVGVAVSPDGAGRDIGFDELDGAEYAEPRDIAAFTGGAVLFRARFLAETGGFDARYFLYYEDLDLARRGTARGWRYRCIPTSVVHHRVSATTTQLGDRARYFQERNRLRFAFRFGNAALIIRAVWLSIRRLRWAPRRVHAKALAAGLVSAPGSLIRRLGGRSQVRAIP